MTEDEAKKVGTLAKAVDEARAEWNERKRSVERARGEDRPWIEITFEYEDEHRRSTCRKEYVRRADFVALLQIQEIAARRNLEQARAMLAAFNP